MTAETEKYIKDVENYIQRIKYRGYSSGGVMHIAEPAWLSDIRELIKIIEFLIKELKNGRNVETPTS